MNIDWNLVILCVFAAIALIAVVYLLVLFARNWSMDEQEGWQDISPDEYRALPNTSSILLRYVDESGKISMHTCHKVNVKAVVHDLQERGCSDIHILKL